MWADATATSGHYELDNIPFFARQATLGDVVRATEPGERLMFDAVVSRSGSSLIRVVAYDDAHIAEIRAALVTLGCSTEAYSSRSIIAVDVPPQASLRDVQRYLADLEERDVFKPDQPYPDLDPHELRSCAVTIVDGELGEELRRTAIGRISVVHAWNEREQRNARLLQPGALRRIVEDLAAKAPN